jgi:hypothetical protein
MQQPNETDRVRHCEHMPAEIGDALTIQQRRSNRNRRRRRARNTLDHAHEHPNQARLEHGPSGRRRRSVRQPNSGQPLLVGDPQPRHLFADQRQPHNLHRHQHRYRHDHRHRERPNRHRSAHRRKETPLAEYDRGRHRARPTARAREDLGGSSGQDPGSCTPLLSCGRGRVTNAAPARAGRPRRSSARRVSLRIRGRTTTVVGTPIRPIYVVDERAYVDPSRGDLIT